MSHTGPWGSVLWDHLNEIRVLRIKRKSSMSKEIPETPTIARRFLACTQSRGGIGKTTFAEALISWLNFARVPYGAMDADPQNQTLSRRYPNEVHLFDATKTKADFLRLMMALPDDPVILV